MLYLYTFILKKITIFLIKIEIKIICWVVIINTYYSLFFKMGQCIDVWLNILMFLSWNDFVHIRQISKFFRELVENSYKRIVYSIYNQEQIPDLQNIKRRQGILYFVNDGVMLSSNKTITFKQFISEFIYGEKLKLCYNVDLSYLKTFKWHLLTYFGNQFKYLSLRNTIFNDANLYDTSSSFIDQDTLLNEINRKSTFVLSPRIQKKIEKKFSTSELELFYLCPVTFTYSHKINKKVRNKFRLGNIWDHYRSSNNNHETVHYKIKYDEKTNTKTLKFKKKYSRHEIRDFVKFWIDKIKQTMYGYKSIEDFVTQYIYLREWFSNIETDIIDLSNTNLSSCLLMRLTKCKKLILDCGKIDTRALNILTTNGVTICTKFGIFDKSGRNIREIDLKNECCYKIQNDDTTPDWNPWEM